ncbi:MAG: hypothetical protein JWP94_2321 [Mucilaginibacter sp.]|nr:hypothetical protein [Mucilaginibacter sp.]
MQIEELNDQDQTGFEFTAEDIKILDERRQKRLSRESAIYSWKEAKNIIAGKKDVTFFC